MISIIIPAHNEKESLGSLLTRLEGFITKRPIEVIVALSCETNDGSEDIIRSSKVELLRCRGKGRAAQMNAAVQKSRGEILVFLHADVIPPNSFYQDIRNTLDGTYDAGYFSYKFDKESFFLKINAKFTTKDGVFTGGGDQCLFIKRKAFLRLGGFDEQQVLMEDFEFFDRMKRNKIRYKIINNDLIVSARKYKNNSYIRVNLSNLAMLVLYRIGYPPKKLKSLYHRFLRTEYQTNT